MADDPRLFYDRHIFLCNNVRAEGHPRGCCMARAEAAGGFDKLRGYAREKARQLGIKPLARFVAFATAGYKPEEMGLGPVYAIPKVLKMAGLSLDDISVIELNEAFAAQALSVIKEAGLDISKINPNGGAVALGHPLGCTGAKLTATIIRELKRKNGKYGIVTMCIGGGMGAAGIIENLT